MRKLIRVFTRNLYLKAAALLLALITWYYLATAGVEDRRFAKVAVRPVNLPRDVALLSQGDRYVSILLKGPRGQLDALDGRYLVAQVDLGNVRLEPGQTLTPSHRLDREDIRIAVDAENTMRLPESVRFAGAEPEAVRMTLDSVTEKPLTVEPTTEGHIAPGYEFRTSAMPQSVLVRGPFRLLQNLASIATEPIAVDGLREKLSRPARLQTEITTREFGTVAIFPAHPSVEVLLDVREKDEEKTIERVPVRLAALPENLAVIQQEVREVTVKLLGPQRLLRDLDAQSVVAEIALDRELPPEREPRVLNAFIVRKDVRQVTERGGSIPLPSDVQLVDVQPKTVQLTLDRVSTSALPVKPILEGAPAEDYEVSEITVVPEKVNVQGPQTIISQLKAIETLPVLVSGVKERLRRSARLVDTVDVGPYRGVKIEPAQRLVDVVVAVAERRVSKTLTDLPVQLLVTPRVAFNINVTATPKTVGSVTFVGPRSRMATFTADSVVALVRLKIETARDLQTTICNLEFYIRDPQVHLAPDTKPIPVEIQFTPPARSPEAPTKKE